MNFKEIWKQHQTTILCVIAILALAFPLISVTSDYSDVTVTGFAAIEESFFALLLIILPVILAASNYITQLKKHKSLLGVGVPVFCILLLVLVFFTCKSGATAGSDMFSAFGVDVKVRPGFCVFLAGATYVALGFFGLRNYKGTTSNTKNTTSTKTSTIEIFENMQEKASQVADRIKNAASDTVANHVVSDNTVPRKSVSINRTNDILALIEKLAAMKDAGVLTEEEFSEKKKALLEEI